MPVKTNRIELDKTKGLTIQVINGLTRSKQTIFLDGGQITITVEGLLGTSVIEQTPTSITMSANEVTINAKTLTLNAELEASMSAGALPVPVVPSKIGDKIGGKVKDKFGDKVAEKLAQWTPTDPTEMTPGPTRVTLVPAAASVLSPEIALTAEGNINAIAPTVTVTGTEVTTVTAPGGELTVEGSNVTVAGTVGMQILAPDIVIAGAVVFIPVE